MLCWPLLLLWLIHWYFLERLLLLLLPLLLNLHCWYLL